MSGHRRQPTEFAEGGGVKGELPLDWEAAGEAGQIEHDDTELR